MGHIRKDHELVARQAEGKPLANTGFVDRMKLELEALNEKVSKLSDFLASGKVNNLPGEDQDLLYAQHDAMRTYGRILDIRLNRAQTPKPKTVDTAGEILDEGVRLAKPHPAEPLPFSG